MLWISVSQNAFTTTELRVGTERQLGITNKNVVIDSNYIQNQTVTKFPLAVGLQGISIFDGFWQNVSITNNLSSPAASLESP